MKFAFDQDGNRYIVPRISTRFMKISEVAEYCHVSRSTVERWIVNRKETHFPRRWAVSNPRIVQFRKQDIDAWIDKLAMAE